MSRPQDADRNQDATCYVGNIDDRATDALVWELMLQAGPVVNVHLPKDRVTMTHQGYGFAEFQTEIDAEYACKIMNGIKLYGKPLKVNKASSDRKQVNIGANLFVGNLDAGVDERLLYETFSAFGTVIGVPKVSRDEGTGQSKHFGFVSFDSFEASDAAIEALNNQFLLNRPINVQYAMKKDGKGGERHGTAAERLLAAQARKNNVLPDMSRIFPPPQMQPRPPPQPPATMQQQPSQQYGGAPPGAPPPGMPPGADFSSSQYSNGYGISGNGASSQHGQPPPGPPPYGMGAPGYAQGMVPPPGPPPQAMAQHMYTGPPPPSGPPPPPGPAPHFMTGSNNAPLGPRNG